MWKSYERFNISKCFVLNFKLLYEPRSIAVYDYTNVVFTALFGFAFFSQVPDALSVIGFAVILLAAFGMRRS